MKQNNFFCKVQWWNSLLMASLILLTQCTPVNPFDPDPGDPNGGDVSRQTITFSVIDAADDTNEQSFVFELTFPDDNVVEYTSDVEEFVLDASEFDAGTYTYQVVKDDYFSEAYVFELSGDLNTEIWNIPAIAYITEIAESVTVTPAEGGTIVVENEEEEEVAEVVVPAGAVDENVAISVTKIETAQERGEIEVVEGHIPVNSYLFLPEGQEFDEPITVTFVVPETDIPLYLGFYDQDTDTWEYNEVTVTGTTGTAQISHFSQYQLFEGYEAIEEPTDTFSEEIDYGKSECDEDITGIYTQFVNPPEHLRDFFVYDAILYPNGPQIGLDLELGCSRDEVDSDEELVGQLFGSHEIYKLTIFVAEGLDSNGELIFGDEEGSFEYPGRAITRCVHTPCSDPDPDHAGGGGTGGL